MKFLTLLFDERCRWCQRAIAWLGEQPLHVPIELVAIGSDEARRRFPSLSLETLRSEVHVIDDDDNYWRGAKAWIVVLWATRKHRQRALSMADHLDTVTHVVDYLSRHRFGYQTPPCNAA